MSQFFTEYCLATATARTMATQYRLDVAVRAGKEFNTPGFSVHFASHADSDYARAEIIKSGEPLSQQEMDALARAEAPAHKYGATAT